MKNRANWIAFAILFIIVGGIWFWNAHSFQSEKANFQENGVFVKGTIRSGEYVRIGKSRNYEVRVSYTTKSDEIMGDVIFANCRLLNGTVFNQISQGMDVDLVYLPENPEQNTVLAMSLVDENIELLDNYMFAYLLLVAGLFSFVVSLALKKKS